MNTHLVGGCGDVDTAMALNSESMSKEMLDYLKNQLQEREL